MTGDPPPALPRASPSGDPGHSDIFDRLHAKNDSSLVSIVAYGLYQREKRAWIADFCKQNGRYPDQKEREAFSFGYREPALDALCTDAEGALVSFAEEIIEQRIDEMRTEALDREIRDTLDSINGKIRKLESYKHHIIGHLLGFCVLVGLVAILALIINFEPTLESIYHWSKLHL